MNPLTNTKNQAKMNKRELELGMAGTVASWHYQFKDSAWIFIGGLNHDLTEGDVITVFSQYGEVVNLNLVRDKATGKAKGFAFLCYENQQSTVLAVDNFNGIKVLGRTIRVDHVKDYKVPKDDEDDEDEVRKLVRREGCAPEVKVEKLSKKVNKMQKAAKEDGDEHLNMQSNSVLKGNNEDWSEYALKVGVKEEKGESAASGNGSKRKVDQRDKEKINDDKSSNVKIKEEKLSDGDEYGNNITEAIDSARKKNKKSKDDDDDKSTKRHHTQTREKSDGRSHNKHHHHDKSPHDNGDSDEGRKKKESKRSHHHHHNSSSRSDKSSKYKDDKYDDDRDRSDHKRTKRHEDDKDGSITNTKDKDYNNRDLKERDYKSKNYREKDYGGRDEKRKDYKDKEKNVAHSESSKYKQKKEDFSGKKDRHKIR